MSYGTLEPTRPVMTRAEAEALAPRLRRLVADPNFQTVSIVHTARAITRIVNGVVMSTDDGDTVAITFHSLSGSGIATQVETNQKDRGLERVLAHVAAMTPPPNKFLDEEDRKAMEKAIEIDPPPLPPVSLWHTSTLQAMTAVRENTVPVIMEQLRAARIAHGATVGTMARTTMYCDPSGHVAFAEETDAEVTVTGRTSDGAASGWCGQAHRDWSRISVERVVNRAIDLTERSRAVVAIEPQRRVAILGPAAVAELLYGLVEGFMFESGFSPFLSKRPGRKTRLGERVIDSRLTMISDPADPEGGYPPFFEQGSIEPFRLGFPTPAITWIDRGELKALALSVYEAAKRNLTPSNIPESFRLAPVPGTSTLTIDEMIAQCEEGVYVNRLGAVQTLDRSSALMTGATRDGCFLIKRGKIQSAIKNLRFVESPIFALNNLMAIGKPERVALGTVLPTSYRFAPFPTQAVLRGWPRLPVIVPPLMVKDFNFSALADSV